MIKAGTCLWNAGIFLFKAVDLITAFETLAPDNFKLTKDSVRNCSVRSWLYKDEFRALEQA